MNEFVTYYCSICKKVFTYTQTKFIGNRRHHVGIQFAGVDTMHHVQPIPPPGYRE